MKNQNNTQNKKFGASSSKKSVPSSVIASGQAKFKDMYLRMKHPRTQTGQFVSDAYNVATFLIFLTVALINIKYHSGEANFDGCRYLLN